MKALYILLLNLNASLIFAQNGITWSGAMNVAISMYGNVRPRITTDANGNPLVIWGRQSDESVFISRWNGSAFTTPLKINPSWLTLATQNWQGPHIAAKGDTVYVVAKRTPEALDTNHIYIMRSIDGGMTFSAPSRVDFIADSISRFPTVAIDDSGNPIVGFMKINPNMSNPRWVVAKSSDLGNTFTTDVKASGWSGPGALVCDCCPGAILFSDGFVAMLYRDHFAMIRDMWAGISDDGGNSFSLGFGFDQGNWMLMSCPSSGPDGVIINDTLYAAYMSGSSGSSMVYFSAVHIMSLTGAPGNLLTAQFAGLNSQNYPRVAGAGNSVAVVWKQEVAGVDQLALKFTSNISNGFPAVYDTVDLGNVTNTDVAVTNGNIFIVWQDDNLGTVRYRSGTYTLSAIEESQVPDGFTIYPNPVSEILHIKFSKKDYSIISASDVCGRTIFSSRVLNSQNEIQFNTREWAGGVYFVTVSSENSLVTKKVCIAK